MKRDQWPSASGPVLCVVGARPNFMKMAPILRAFAAHNPVLHTLLVHTGHEEPSQDHHPRRGVRAHQPGGKRVARPVPPLGEVEDAHRRERRDKAKPGLEEAETERDAKGEAHKRHTGHDGHRQTVRGVGHFVEQSADRAETQGDSRPGQQHDHDERHALCGTNE